ncbi:MAG: type I-B CRISPR-associated protein Cas7/Csh2 [Dethiobacteria bacterium]|jgi:CRISPR-associated protein Csh2
MAEIVKNRMELLFLYDVTDANPNGDPLDENKPRLDEETWKNIVTDVRLKRTIRDYLHDYLGQDIFVLELRDENDNLKTKEDRLKKYLNNEDILKKCIDVRLFGATTAVKGKTMTLTGPVQFKFGRSLHRVDLSYIKGTTVMPSAQDKKQGTFTEKYILPYSLIAFYGVVNENAAIRQNIPLTGQDIELLLEGMWQGTKNLLSTSKAGQMPRLLLQIVYQEKNYHLGELDKRIRFLSEKNDEEIRDITEGCLEIDPLVASLKEQKGKIQRIRYKIDSRLTIRLNGEDLELPKALEGLPVEKISI